MQKMFFGTALLICITLSTVVKEQAVKAVGDGDQLVHTKRNNKTDVYTDFHRYYTSHYYLNGGHMFMDLMNKTAVSDRILKVVQVLKDHHRFHVHTRFYGQPISSVVVTLDGYLNVWPKYLPNMRFTHYIAPIMGNFSANASDSTSGLFVGIGKEHFVVQWNKMNMIGTNVSYTFQAILFNNGTIVMAYKEVPLSLFKYKFIDQVKTGVSDGFTIPYKMKDPNNASNIILHYYIFMYHEVKLNATKLQRNVAFELLPMKTCGQMKSCATCMSNNNFNCRWCPSLNICSDTLSWHRLEWVQSKCETNAYHDLQQCFVMPHCKINGLISIPVLLVCIVVLLISICFGMWVVYAYRNPQSASGRWLIEHRPRTWCRRNDNNSPLEEELI